MTDTQYTLIGGDGKKYWLHDKNADTNDATVENSIQEYGWGRIEISPAQQAKTDNLLTLLYVTDASNDAAPVKATDISTDTLAGTQIFDRALLFPKSDMLIEDTVAFTVAGNSKAECFLAGIKAGKWTVTDSDGTKTLEVAEGENLLTFTVAAGKVTVSAVK